MKKYEIHLADWQRILFGETPPIFLLEVFIRTLIVYLFLLITLRWLGKRMSGQLTILEMAVMLTLGAIVSVGMQTPDRGILISMFVLGCTLVFHRGLSWLGIHSARMEELSQGKISTLVKDGIMQLDEMQRCRISRQQVFEQLRSKGIFSLGDVRRLYLEACGLFSTIRQPAGRPGLSTLPPGDNSVLSLLHYSNNMACTSCGHVDANSLSVLTCPVCGARTWTEAITTS